MSTQAGTEQVAEDLRRLARDLEALLQATTGQTGEKLERLRAQATESLHQARERLAHAEEAAVREIRDAAASVDEHVRERPWQAVGIAAGVGLLIGLLIGRR